MRVKSGLSYNLLIFNWSSKSCAEFISRAAPQWSVVETQKIATLEEMVEDSATRDIKQDRGKILYLCGFCAESGFYADSHLWQR